MKIIDSTVVSKSKFVTVVAVSYEDQKGNRKRWHMVSRGEQPKCITGRTRHPDAAIIVPFHRQENKLVVIKEFRVPVGGYQYGFPAGLLDPGEEMVAAADRELREETGLDLVRVYRHSPAIFSSAGITDESIAIVFAEAAGTPDTQCNEDSEEAADDDLEAVIKNALNLLNEMADVEIGLDPSTPGSHINPKQLAFTIAAQEGFAPAERQEFLEMTSVSLRLKKCVQALSRIV